MADIQYLNYGDLQIELLALLNTLADLVEGYVQKLAWSKKRKEKFMSAYSDLINHGILGASNNTGLWMVDVGGSIDLDSMEKKDKEMYQEAAYFIRKQMAGLPTKSSLEEEKKAKIKKFDFNTDFITHVNNTINGGKSLTIGYGDSDLWNYLDERDANGVRGRKNRANKLADLLKSYDDKLGDGSDYDFEGSPYADINDFRTKLNKAISALRTDSIDDDREALQAIGLNQADWFNNGSGDPSGKVDKDGNQLTFGQLAEYNKAVDEAKLKETEERSKQEALLALLRAYNNTLFFSRVTNPKMHGRSPVELKEKYGDGNTLMTVLLLYAQSNIKRLTPDELSELHGAYRFLAKDPIDLKLLKSLLSSSSGLYKNAPLSRFKKINGIDNLIWDSAVGQIIQIQTRDEYNATRGAVAGTDLLGGVKTTADRKLEYYNQTGMTEADWEELAGIGLDIASIVDPEPWSAGGLGVAAAFSRNLAANKQPGKKSLMDHVWQGVDYLTGALGAVPGLGDAALAYKVYKRFGPWLKGAMRISSVRDFILSTPGMISVSDKLINGNFTDMTVQDWKTLGQFVRALVTTRNLNVLNRAGRKALLERGIEVNNSKLALWGLTSSKPKAGTTQPTIKIKGSEKEIPISTELKQELDKSLIKKGNDVKARNETIIGNEKVLAAAEKAGIKVKEKVTDADGKVTEQLTDAWKNTLFEYSSPLLNARIFGNRLGILPKSMRSSGGMYGTTKPAPVERGLDNFENYLNTRSGFKDRFLYGSNRTLRGMDRLNGFGPDKSKLLSVETMEGNYPAPDGSNYKYTGHLSGDESLTFFKKSLPSRDTQHNVGIMRRWNDMRHGKFSKRDISTGAYKIGDENVHVYNTSSPSGEKLITITTSAGRKELAKSLEEAKKVIAKIVLELRKTITHGNTNKSNIKELGKVLQDLKRKGWLKQGGRITDSQVDNFLRQYK